MNNTASLADLKLLLPELILVGAALGLILFARRLQKAPWATAVTVVAALAAAVAAACPWVSLPQDGFAEMIRVDGYSQFFKVLIAVALAMAALLGERRIDDERVRLAEFHSLLLLATSGMMFAVSASDLLTLYLGLELMTLCSYILVGITIEKPRSNEAAIKYFLVGSFASALFLYGIALAYAVTGETGLTRIAEYLRENEVGSQRILLAAIGLIGAGLAFKIAAFPFHVWAPDAYQGTTVPVAAFLAAASKAAGLAAIGRVCLVAFASQADTLSHMLTGLAALSIIAGSLIAVAQTDMKRLLAYSSIAHAGYALLGFVAGTHQGVTATMTYAFLYVFMTLGAFGVVIALGERGERLDGYRGLAAQRPGIAALMLLFLLSLTGIPPTAGFVAKFVVILSVVKTGQITLAVLAVLCSVVTAFVYLRVAVHMYMLEPSESAPAPTRCPWGVSAALAVAAVVTIMGGILPQSLASWAASWALLTP